VDDHLETIPDPELDTDAEVYVSQDGRVFAALVMAIRHDDTLVVQDSDGTNYVAFKHEVTQIKPNTQLD
jgi:hypothetical protein